MNKRKIVKTIYCCEDCPHFKILVDRAKEEEWVACGYNPSLRAAPPKLLTLCTPQHRTPIPDDCPLPQEVGEGD